MRRVVLVSLTVLCLLFVSSIAGLIQVVKAEGGTITINTDGSITPSTAPIHTADNITYTLTGNMSYPTYNGIVVERNNTVIDGNGYTMQGNYRDTIYGISLMDMSNVTIEFAHILTFQDGIYLSGSNNNIIVENTATANSVNGILLIYSNNNVVSGNNVTANNQGIEIDSSSNNIVGGNDVTANALFLGIYLQSSSDNIVSGNNVTANNVGIQLESSSNNTVSSNNVTASDTAGIALDYSSNNTIYHNNFINNTYQFISRYSTNTWDDGYPSGGNYWSDYQTLYPNASEIDSSGIWNTPYVINFWFGFAFESETNNTDNYPLMTPVTIVPEFPSFLILTLFMMATLLPVIIYKKKATPYKRL